MIILSYPYKIRLCKKRGLLKIPLQSSIHIKLSLLATSSNDITSFSNDFNIILNRQFV